MRVSDGSHRYRQYAGLALVTIAYVGGIIGWSCAVLQVDARPSTDANPAETTHRHVTPPAVTPSHDAETRMRITRTKWPDGTRAFTDG